MPIDYEYISEKNVLELKVTGVLKSEEIIEYFQKVLWEDPLKRDFVEVVDLNDVTDFVLRYSDLETIAEQTKKLNAIGQKVTIMCGYSEVSKGVSSMMTPLYQRANFTYYVCDSEKDLRFYLSTLT